MGNNPLVSIVMPVYNAQEYLSEALDSLYHQSYRNLEIICVDDGSTDQSLDILKEYAKYDKRFRYIQQQNQFAGVARNNGLKHVTGKYVMFLDSDDVFERNMIRDLVKIAELKNTDIIFFGFFHFKKDIKHRSLMGIPYTSRTVTSAQEHRQDLFQIGQGVPWNRFYNVDFVRKTGLQFQKLQSNNDVFFSKAIMLYADRMLFLRKRYVNYRINNSNSLQGSYKVLSGNFVKCTVAIFDQLNNLEKYDLYKDSFESYAIESALLTLAKCRDRETFIMACSLLKSSFETMKIDERSENVKNSDKRRIIESILLGNYDDTIFEMYKYTEENSRPKSSIEIRIGKKLLSAFKIKCYD